MIEKHTGYYEILESLKFPGCSLCHYVKVKVEKYYDNLLYENVNDVKFRERFHSDMGFCNTHTKKLIDYNDGVAIAIMHKYILENSIEELLKNKILNFSGKKNRCIICDYIKETEKIFLSVFIDFLNDIWIKDKYIKSDGFCIPHYILLSKTKKELPQWLKNFQLNKYKEILNKIDAYIQSHNVSENKKSIVTPATEGSIWKVLINTLFGNLMDR